jgi:hypothetical protein
VAPDVEVAAVVDVVARADARASWSVDVDDRTVSGVDAGVVSEHVAPSVASGLG